MFTVDLMRLSSVDDDDVKEKKNQRGDMKSERGVSSLFCPSIEMF
jgi:hypothetical protein